MPAVIFQLASVAAFVWLSVVQVVQALTTKVGAVAANALRAIGVASSEVIVVYDDYDKVLAAPLTQAQLREGRKGSEVFKEEDSGKRWHVNKVYTDFIADTEKPAWHWSSGQLLKQGNLIASVIAALCVPDVLVAFEC
jgi:hypothetical protein